MSLINQDVRFRNYDANDNENPHGLMPHILSVSPALSSLSGSEPPLDSVGKIGDIYYGDAGTIYKKVSGAWEILYAIPVSGPAVQTTININDSQVSNIQPTNGTIGLVTGELVYVETGTILNINLKMYYVAGTGITQFRLQNILPSADYQVYTSMTPQQSGLPLNELIPTFSLDNEVRIRSGPGTTSLIIEPCRGTLDANGYTLQLTFTAIRI